MIDVVALGIGQWTVVDCCVLIGTAVVAACDTAAGAFACVLKQAACSYGSYGLRLLVPTRD